MASRPPGIGFGYHNHHWEFQKGADGKFPMDILLEAAPNMEWEMDLAWVVKGGEDPVTWMDKYGNRITAIHVKDIAPAGEKLDEDGWADLGHGTLDWKSLIKTIQAEDQGEVLRRRARQAARPDPVRANAIASVQSVELTMAKTYGIGIMGAGNISSAYLRLAPLFKGLEVRGVADIVPAAAQKQSEAFGVTAMTPDEMLKNSEIDVIVNLTIPAAHYGISMAAITAGKHAYSEKPFVLSVKEGKALKKEADKRGLYVGSAPDTFLGGAHQQVRDIIDSGVARQDHVGHHPRDEPRHGALASQPGLLLPARRRSGPRHRALLRHRPDPPHRPGEAGHRLHRHGAQVAHRHDARTSR